ncbi:hypothetical protein [Nocardia brasiliensis]|uniref:hypothetical protein n=1 Tax=Nocardia brasiliensis TaxID=37326 RepID=UPI0024540D47|nr:hypothetical protein [Nocardia brasiliensis]
MTSAAQVFLKPQRAAGRYVDLVSALLLCAGAFLFGMSLSFVVGMLGAPGGQASECTGACRTYADAGVYLMGYGTCVLELVVLALVVRSWRRRRIVSVWPMWSFPALVVLAAVSVFLVFFGPAFPGDFLPTTPEYLPSVS